MNQKQKKAWTKRALRRARNRGEISSASMRCVDQAGFVRICEAEITYNDAREQARAERHWDHTIADKDSRMAAVVRAHDRAQGEPFDLTESRARHTYHATVSVPGNPLHTVHKFEIPNAMGARQAERRARVLTRKKLGVTKVPNGTVVKVERAP